MGMVHSDGKEADWTQCCPPEGFFPPYGIFVEFQLHEGDALYWGLAAGLAAMGPRLKHETVFIALGREDMPASEAAQYPKVFFPQTVEQWRETQNMREAMKEFL